MTWWLIEMQGPSYLSARHLGGYEFHWDNDANKAIRFINQEQADLVMMAVRQMRPELFPSCLPRPISAVEHCWVSGEGIVRRI